MRRRGVLYFDLETADADRLHDYGAGFVRLAAWAWGDGPVTVTDDVDALVAEIDRAAVVVGHNVLAFDLPALGRYHGLDVDALVEADRVVDTLLVARQNDPPRAGGVDRGRYRLSELGKRLVGADKLGADAGGSALKKLADRHGGYDRIPVDDSTYRAYAAQDVELTRAVAACLRVDAYCRREMRVMWRLGVIERHGVRVAVDVARDRIAAQEVRRGAAMRRLADLTGMPLEGKAPHATAAGKAAIEAAMVACGVNPPRTPRGALATNADALATLRADHPDNAALLELVDAVGTVTGERGFAETVMKHVTSDGRVHPRVSAEQATGRISVTRPGLTTSGKRDRKALMERALLLPDDDDHVLIAADLSQIDARAMALLSGDPAYIAAFDDGKDFHSAMAEAIFGTDGWDGVGRHPRRSDAKPVTHGSSYGMGPAGLARSAGIPEDEAAALLARLDQQFPQLAAYKAWIREEARQQILRTPFGRTMRIEPGREWTQAPAAMGQGTARDLMMEGVLRLPGWLADGLRLVVHDEIVVSVPRARADEAREALLDALELGGCAATLGEASIHIRADVSPPGRDWLDCYREEVPQWPDVAHEHRRLPSCTDPACAWHNSGGAP